MKALILALKKIITVITAILVPATSTTPAVLQTNNQPVDASSIEVVVAPQPEENEPEYEIVEDTQNMAPSFTEDNALLEDDDVQAPAEENPAEEIPAQSETADSLARDEEFVAVKTWNVSATDDDNVTMSFYDTEDTDALLEQLTGKITALFTPMVAYAAEDRTVDSTEEADVITEGDSTVTIYKEDAVNTGDVENGSTGRTAADEEIVAGTVVITGNGDMMDYVYNYFVSPELFVSTVKDLFMKYQGLDVTPIYDETLTDIVEIDATIKWQITGTDRYAEYSDRMIDAMNPANMLKYSPVKVIIEDGVTNISDEAFAFCAGITEVEIRSDLREIGADAFAYCKNLKKINIPETVEVIGAGAFYQCTALTSVVLPASITDVQEAAFADMANNIEIVCPSEEVKEMLIANNAFYDCPVNLVVA